MGKAEAALGVFVKGRGARAAAPKHTTLRSGVEVDGKYVLEEELGRGGFGVVFSAVYRPTGRRRAVKFLLSRRNQATTSEVRAFFAEAKAQARFDHPGMTVVHEVGQWRDAPYIAMELLGADEQGRRIGAPLRALLERRRVLHPGEAAEILASLLSPMECLHDNGHVHQDLKPDNVFVFDDGRVKLMDFGLMVALGPRARSFFTRTGQSFPRPQFGGTPGYLAPDAMAHGTTPASDIWAVGVMLFEMVTGQRPEIAALVWDARGPAVHDWQGDMAALARAQVPQGMVRLLRRCLSMDPAERPSATSLRIELEALLPCLRARLPFTAEAPYRGLAAFSPDSACVFFGRDRVLEKLRRHLGRERFLALVASSGSGKSSVILGGLIPRLRAERHVAYRTVVWTPGPHPQQSLLFALQSQELASLRATALPSVDTTIEELATAGRTLLLVVDQAEELVTLTPARPWHPGQAALEAPADRAAAWLLRLHDARSHRVRVVLTLRSDLEHEFDRWPALHELIRAQSHFLRPPRRSDLRQALEFPARLWGVTIADDLQDVLLEHVYRQPTPLPVLQLTADLLWKGLENRRDRIDLTDLLDVGGIEGIMGRHALGCLRRIEAAHGTSAGRACRTALAALTDPRGHARPQGRQELLRWVEQLAASKSADIIEALVNARLLVARRHSNQDVEYTLISEALIRGWPELTRWAHDFDDLRALSREISADAGAWIARGRRVRDPHLWTQGAARIQRARDVIARIEGGALPPLSREALDFLRASVRAVSRQRVERLGMVAAAFLALVALTSWAWRQREAAEVSRVDGVYTVLHAAARAAPEASLSLPFHRAALVGRPRVSPQAIDALNLPGAATAGLALPGHRDAIHVLATHPQSRWLWSGDHDGRLALRDRWSDHPMRWLNAAAAHGGPDPIYTLSATRRGDRWLTTTRRGGVAVWDAEGRLIGGAPAPADAHNQQPFRDAIRAAAIQSSAAVTISATGLLQRWDLRAKKGSEMALGRCRIAGCRDVRVLAVAPREGQAWIACDTTKRSSTRDASGGASVAHRLVQVDLASVRSRRPGRPCDVRTRHEGPGRVAELAATEGAVYAALVDEPIPDDARRSAPDGRVRLLRCAESCVFVWRTNLTLAEAVVGMTVRADGSTLLATHRLRPGRPCFGTIAPGGIVSFRTFDAEGHSAQASVLDVAAPRVDVGSLPPEVEGMRLRRWCRDRPDLVGVLSHGGGTWLREGPSHVIDGAPLRPRARWAHPHGETLSQCGCGRHIVTGGLFSESEAWRAGTRAIEVGGRELAHWPRMIHGVFRPGTEQLVLLGPSGRLSQVAPVDGRAAGPPRRLPTAGRVAWVFAGQEQGAVVLALESGAMVHMPASGSPSEPPLVLEGLVGQALLAVATSPSGAMLAAGWGMRRRASPCPAEENAQGDLRIWRRSTTTKRARWRAVRFATPPCKAPWATSWVRALTFSRDDELLAVAADGAGSFVIDVSRPKPLLLRGSDNPRRDQIVSIAWSADGRWLAAGGHGRAARIYAGDTIRRALGQAAGQVRPAARITLGGAERLHGLDDGRVWRVLFGPPSPDEPPPLLVVAGGAVSLWDWAVPRLRWRTPLVGETPTDARIAVNVAAAGDEAVAITAAPNTGVRSWPLSPQGLGHALDETMPGCPTVRRWLEHTGLRASDATPFARACRAVQACLGQLRSPSESHAHYCPRALESDDLAARCQRALQHVSRAACASIWDAADTALR